MEKLLASLGLLVPMAIQPLYAQENFSFDFGGRLQLDYNHSELNGVPDETQWVARRLWLEASGDLGENWEYKWQQRLGEANGGDQSDAYLKYTGFGPAASIIIGQQFEPLGLEQRTSSNDLTFSERSSTTELYNKPRLPGVALEGVLENQTFYSLMVAQDVPNYDDLSYSGRLGRFWQPAADTSYQLALGFMRREMQTNAVALMASGVSGPFHAHAEYYQGERNGSDRSGYFVQAGWVITGEVRAMTPGKVRRVQPAASPGVFEMALRHSGGDGNYADIELGRVDAEAWGVAMSWYVTNNLKLSASYDEGSSNQSNDQGSESRFRFQYLF